MQGHMKSFVLYLSRMVLVIIVVRPRFFNCIFSLQVFRLKLQPDFQFFLTATNSSHEMKNSYLSYRMLVIPGEISAYILEYFRHSVVILVFVY